MRPRLLLIGAALLAFGASLVSGFHFDDYAIFAGRALRAPGGWLEVWRLEQTRPLTYLTFWLNYQVGGETPWGYHAFNLLLHAGAVLLLYDVLNRLLERRAALFAALLFAVHPLAGESVNYVWARSTLLAAVLALASVRAWLRERDWQAVAWFAAALLAKEECAALPLLLLLSDRRRWRPALAMAVLAVAAAVRVIYAAAVTPGAPIAQAAGIGPWRYGLAEGPVVARYLQLLLLPWGFSIDPGPQVPPIWLGLLAWAAIAGAALLALRRNRDVGRWLVAGLVLLAPTSTLFPAADLAADRRMYLPLAAFAGGLGILLARTRPVVGKVVVAVLLVLAIARTTVWMSDQQLWREAAERAPSKLRPKLQLARLVPPDEALGLLTEARRLAPESAEVAAETGALHLRAGRPAEALAEFGRALALAPNDARYVNNRGTALEALGQTAAARSDYERALSLNPELAPARDNLRRLNRPF